MTIPRLLVLAAAVVATILLGRTEAAGAATPIVSSHCPQVVSGAVRLQTDLICRDRSGLIVGSHNTSIDLNGHKIICVGPALEGSCQGVFEPHRDEIFFPRNDPDPDIGVDTAGFSGVRVFSGAQRRGTIDGFDVGVRVLGSAGVQVQRLFVTGPENFETRPVTHGILVESTPCGRGHVQLGGGHRGNEISNHTFGIELSGAACVHIVGNFVHDNQSVPFVGFGIHLENSPRNLVHRNNVFRNGWALGDAGLGLTGPATVLNVITENHVNSNSEDGGIVLRNGAAENFIAANTMLFNAEFDAAGFGAPNNHWAKSNICRTQNEEVPPGVCNPDEG
jgi:hypothetical protein